MKQCEFCGQDFEPKTKKGTFCSPACKMKLQRLKAKGETPLRTLKPSEVSDLLGHDNFTMDERGIYMPADVIKFGTCDAPKIRDTNSDEMAFDASHKFPTPKPIIFRGPEFLSEEQQELISIGEAIKPILVELKCNVQDFIKLHRQLAEKKADKKDISKPAYTAPVDAKIINPNAPKTKQQVEPPVGSKAWQMKYDKYD